MSDYIKKYQGRFVGIMQWDDCNALLEKLIAKPQDWFLYNTLEKVPKDVCSEDFFISELTSIKKIITDEHQERYCGIVYVDDVEAPSFVKIFHPNNLGKSCGSSEHPPIPQWLLSKIKPVDVIKEFGPPEEKSGFISKFLKL